MKRPFLKTIHFIFVRLLRIVKPVTIGVRVMLIRDDKVLLVKHSYQDEWYFPGGGVKKKERLDQAARRESLEEVGATLGRLELFGVYTNFIEGRTDHITVYLCDDFTIETKKDWEIEVTQFFPLNKPPQDIAKGIGRRINDYLEGKSASGRFGDW
jgi:8-oxo-dGTP pyrophosphatase MutT (NUDIX family)